MGVEDKKTLAQLDYRVCSQLHSTEIPFRRGAGGFNRRPRQLFLQKDVEEGVVNLNLAVIFDEPQSSEAIHEEIYSRSGRANHLRPIFPG